MFSKMTVIWLQILLCSGLANMRGFESGLSENPIKIEKVGKKNVDREILRKSQYSGGIPPEPP